MLTFYFFICASLLVPSSATRPAAGVASENVDALLDTQYAQVATINVEPLATISPIDPVKVQNVTLSLESAVPVFKMPLGKEPGYLALLIRHSDDAWKALKVNDGSVTCVSGSGDEKATHDVIFFGGASDAAYKSHLVGHCPLPASAFDQKCHEVELQDAGVHVGKVRGCHVDATTALSETKGVKNYYSTLKRSRKVRLAACVKPLYHVEANPKLSGLLKFPQWLEYHSMHGVEHFVIYTFSNRYPRDRAIMLEAAEPYLEMGAASIVDIDLERFHHQDAQMQAHDLVINDCLYRMKHQAEWLMPSVDVDEYLTWKGFRHRSSFLESIAEHTNENNVYALSFGRYDFQLPKDPFTMLDISSTQRELALANLCPKYVVRPAKVRTLFIHWATDVVNASDNNIFVPPGELVGYHFRKKSRKELADVTADRSLAQQLDLLTKRIEGIRNASVATLLARIHSQAQPHTHSVLQVAKGGGSRDEEFLAQQFPAYIETMRHAERPTILAPPSAGAPHRGAGMPSVLMSWAGHRLAWLTSHIGGAW